jgi:HAD superfamily hydrolase (TIGR01509 family)
LTALTGLPDPAAIVFDLDGTLVDTVPARIEAWLATFAELGMPADRQQITRLIGVDGKRLTREVANRAGRVVDDAEAEAIDRRSGEIFDQLNQRPRPVRGARSLLLELEKGSLPWAIGTSSRAAQVIRSVGALRLPQPPVIVDGSHVEHAKPAPDLLLLAARRLRIPPERCWYAGDATWDVIAARAAGMVAVGMAYGPATVADLLAAGAGAVTTFHGLAADLRRRGLIAGVTGKDRPAG